MVAKGFGALDKARVVAAFSWKSVGKDRLSGTVKAAAHITT